MTRFTGWHMTAIIVGFFGIVIAVNLVMATFAITTFGGTVVDNSYVAGQKYNDWLDDAKQQQRSGWDVAVSRLGNGRVRAELSVPEGVSSDLRLTGFARLPLGRDAETPLMFERDGEAFLSRQALPAGRWAVRIVVSDPHEERARFEQDLKP